MALAAPAPRHRAPALLGLALLLAGCTPLRPLGRQTLHVLLVPNSNMAWLLNDNRDSQNWQPLLDAFRKLHPDVTVEISSETEESLEPSLRIRGSRGLGPDLLLVRAPVAVGLQQEGLLASLPEQGQLMATLPLVRPPLLKRVRTDRGVVGLPVFEEITLACFDRRRVRQPPTTLSALLDLAASGAPVGLSVDPVGLWWTAGSLGAQKAIAPIITGYRPDPDETVPDPAERISTWLSWLRQAALQSRVDVGTNPQDLTMGLESGRLAWIPCPSLALHRLDRTMGRHLGVAPLPGGPGGPASPFGSLRVWALGVDSSPRQRQLALDLITTSLNPLVQRDMTLTSGMVVPANRYVAIPVASSGRLAALAASDQQFRASTPLLQRPFSSKRVAQVLPPMQTITSRVMVGMMGVRQGTEALMRFYPPPQ